MDEVIQGVLIALAVIGYAIFAAIEKLLLTGL